MPTTLQIVPPNFVNKLHVLGLDGDSASVKSRQIRMLEKFNEICLARFMQGLDSGRLEAEVCLVIGLSVKAGQSHIYIEGHTLYSSPTSRMRRLTGSLGMRSSVERWYRLISRSATVPGRKR
jgi:hypothetical protein